MRKISGVYGAPKQHWVGDGFPVRSLFSYQSLGAKNISPFLLLDYAGPVEFTPTTAHRGVGQHPHKGFETVTLVYQGEVEHRDSTGAGGVIGPGDVQWMTAGSGIVHQEFHSDAFARSGGQLHMVQLWVNLPAKDKSAPAGYQSITNQQIPVINLPQNAGTVSVVAGEYQQTKGPARTFTDINMWNVKLNAGGSTALNAPEGHNTLLVVVSGTVLINDQQIAREADLICFENHGGEITLEANNDAIVLLLSGEPINEPVVGHGPFVMNTKEEILQAIEDFNQGKMGMIA
ncbi:pirin family protein [Pragia fontium]|uniref:pirin family protein n=1 Tax=Pragia fontium TaxID=82985 RepID=UPI000DF89EBE|nr:pirin family protein [Pragia fontium]SUB83946.1 Quercetin 2,3-dioxygenase [Pragia fontium]VEJ56845.1 Quercetin 2,3-dioxygenase [Pragia fontium]